MLSQDRPLYTPAEYLALEEKAAYKSEYRRGQMVAMAGASLNHNRLAGNIHTALNNRLSDRSCEAFIGDVRLWIPAKELFTYPDVMVICGDPHLFENRPDTVTNPTVIFEILSRSTAGYDRGDKFQAYWTVESFAEYVLVDQYRVHLEYFRRINPGEWFLRVLTKPDQRLSLESLELEIPLSEIYRNVD